MGTQWRVFKKEIIELAVGADYRCLMGDKEAGFRK